jgi:hypothetical protein
MNAKLIVQGDLTQTGMDRDADQRVQHMSLPEVAVHLGETSSLTTATSTTYVNAYGHALDKMNAKIAVALAGRERFVLYSAYLDDEHEIPFDNLNEVAVEGLCAFSRRCFFGDCARTPEKHYVSQQFFNPTWLDICVFVNQTIMQSKDYNHIFLEGIRLKDPAFNLDVLPDGTYQLGKADVLAVDAGSSRVVPLYAIDMGS